MEVRLAGACLAGLGEQVVWGFSSHYIYSFHPLCMQNRWLTSQASCPLAMPAPAPSSAGCAEHCSPYQPLLLPLHPLLQPLQLVSPQQGGSPHFPLPLLLSWVSVRDSAAVAAGGGLYLPLQQLLPLLLLLLLLLHLR